MRAILLGQHEPNTPEWDALRANGIGGSEVAAIVGLSPWVSKFALYHRKRGTLGKQEVNAGMEWGHRLEPVVCEAYAERRTEFWVMGGGTYRHPDRPWQLGNPDRLLFPTDGVTAKTEPLGIFEAKTASAFDAHEWGHGEEDVPPYYRCQAMWYMDVLEVGFADLAVLIGGSDYREYRIAYDAAEAKWLREQGEAFWADVLAGNVPPIDGHDATYEAVREMHPEINGESVEIDPELHQWVTTTKATADAATSEHRAAKATLLDAMGQAKYATVDDQTVYRRQPHGRGGVALYPVPPFRAPKKEGAA